MKLTATLCLIILLAFAAVSTAAGQEGNAQEALAQNTEQAPAPEQNRGEGVEQEPANSGQANAEAAGQEGGAAAEQSVDEVQEPTFAINAFDVRGNTLLQPHKVQSALDPFTGPGMTAGSVQEARDALERAFHQQGYPAVVVNIPEQTVENGIVQLEVIESRIRRIRITGNRYFTHERILSKLPSFRPGNILYLPDIQRELGELNANPDIKVEPSLSPGKKPGTIDIELQVEDRLPLHGHVELNNRHSHDTSELRLNAMIKYDNLWQKEHSASLQIQTSPEDTEEVQVIAASYVMPNPWRTDHFAAFYAVWSDSQTAFGEGFATVGEGQIIGLRYIIPLPGEGPYQHNISLGLDWKSFEDTIDLEDQNVDKTEVTYLPVSASYTGSLADSTGLTEFSAGLNMAFRGLVTEKQEFQNKRFKSRGNYLYATAGLERNQNLPHGASIFAKIDGQIASQPLISNEQYSAGGMESVRGYMESEVLGDHALHVTSELRSPDLVTKLNLGKKHSLIVHAFYDWARLYVKEPLPGEDQVTTIDGVGIGCRGNVLEHFSYDLEWGVPLTETDKTEAYDSVMYFQLRYKF